MPQLPKEGDVIAERYQVGATVGQGGFAAVFRGLDLDTRREIALKVILPQALHVKQVRRRLLREARLTCELSHPNTISVYDCGMLGDEDNGLPYIVMELLRGESMGTRLRRGGPMAPSEVVPVLMQVLGSLSEAHEKGIVHRDLKPDNIFLHETAFGTQAKVLDFGIARAVTGEWGDETYERLTRTGVIPGTVSYMAPEFFNGAPRVTPAADVYALGCMTYKVLTGRPPFQANTPTAVALKHIQELPPPLPSHVSDALAEVIERSLIKAPELRYHDAAQMLEALQEVQLQPEAAPAQAEPSQEEVLLLETLREPASLDIPPNEVVSLGSIGSSRRRPAPRQDVKLRLEELGISPGPAPRVGRRPLPPEVHDQEVSQEVELTRFEVPPPLAARAAPSELRELDAQVADGFLGGRGWLLGTAVVGLAILVLMWLVMTWTSGG
jgi:serine/threonine protein kinase